jgi:hypothetical protein
MERRYEVRSYGVRYVCDACGRGEMVALNGTQAYVQEAGQIKIRHVCTVCHTLATFPDKYPTVRHEDVPSQVNNAVPGYAQPQQQLQPNMQQLVQQPMQQFQQPTQQVGQPTMQQQVPGTNLTPTS